MGGNAKAFIIGARCDTKSKINKSRSMGDVGFKTEHFDPELIQNS